MAGWDLAGVRGGGDEQMAAQLLVATVPLVLSHMVSL